MKYTSYLIKQMKIREINVAASSYNIIKDKLNFCFCKGYVKM